VTLCHWDSSCDVLKDHSWSSNSLLFFSRFTLEMKELRLFGMSGTAGPVTRCHIPEELNLEFLKCVGCSTKKQRYVFGMET
jgi:hypothetical protein